MGKTPSPPANALPALEGGDVNGFRVEGGAPCSKERELMPTPWPGGATDPRTIPCLACPFTARLGTLTGLGVVLRLKQGVEGRTCLV